MHQTPEARSAWLASLKPGDPVQTTYGDGSPSGYRATFVGWGRVEMLMPEDWSEGDALVEISGLGADGKESSGWISVDWIGPI
jgi:hypothetical protein